jgi:hypothetical protein
MRPESRLSVPSNRPTSELSSPAERLADIEYSTRLQQTEQHGLTSPLFVYLNAKIAPSRSVSYKRQMKSVTPSLSAYSHKSDDTVK